MLSDTLTTIENQFFDGLKAVQDPTIEVARRAAELVSQVPLLDRAAGITAQLPSAETVITRNFAFAQRLLDAQREFALELAGLGVATATAPAQGGQGVSCLSARSACGAFARQAGLRRSRRGSCGRRR